MKIFEVLMIVWNYRKDLVSLSLVLSGRNCLLVSISTLNVARKGLIDSGIVWKTVFTV